MRLPALTLSTLPLLLLLSPLPTTAASDGGLYPPGLLPLINRANALLSSGQFLDATRLYSDAIDQSPADYLLYYKRATAYLSLSRHAPALDDFDKVLALTSGSFDSAHLMKARIHVKDGSWDPAREALRLYAAARGAGASPEAAELDAQIEEGHTTEAQMERERGAQLWAACAASASTALRRAPHAIGIRSVRAECALASGDVDSAVGDLTRLAQLLPPSTTLLSTVFRLAYFLLPPSLAPLNTLKQCLHFDPDSRPCLGLHRLHKSFDRAFAQVEEMEGREDWRAIVKLLTAPGGGRNGEVMRRFEEALRENTSREKLLPPQLAQRRHTPEIPLPNALKTSYLRQTLVRLLCRAHTHIVASAPAAKESRAQMEHYCLELLTLDGCADDVDGLVGQGEVFLGKQEWEEAVRVLQRAWEESGHSRRDIHTRLQRAQKLLKQSKQKDYYKVLGVARDADSRTIKKAFRTAAKTAHPDKGGSEAKMAAVNEAYEVLSNPELRARFDNGDDPNDPMAQQGGAYAYPFPGGGGHPFAQFFQQASGGGARAGGGGGFPGGGGFQFKFGGM